MHATELIGWSFDARRLGSFKVAVEVHKERQPPPLTRPVGRRGNFVCCFFVALLPFSFSSFCLSFFLSFSFFRGSVLGLLRARFAAHAN